MDLLSLHMAYLLCCESFFNKRRLPYYYSDLSLGIKRFQDLTTRPATKPRPVSLVSFESFFGVSVNGLVKGLILLNVVRKMTFTKAPLLHGV